MSTLCRKFKGLYRTVYSFINKKKKSYPYIPDGKVGALTSKELNLLDLVNTYRNSLKLNKVIPDSYVSYIAKSRDISKIVQAGYHSGVAEQVWTPLYKTARIEHVGEVVGYKYYSELSCFKSWLKSLPHEKVIRGDWTGVGISIQKDEEGDNTYCLIFVK